MAIVSLVSGTITFITLTLSSLLLGLNNTNPRIDLIMNIIGSDIITVPAGILMWLFIPALIMALIKRDGIRDTKSIKMAGLALGILILTFIVGGIFIL